MGPLKKLPSALTLSQVFQSCDETLLNIKTTKDIKSSEAIISQDRAVRAIHVGLGIRKPGFNIFVAGHDGTGKTSVIKSYLESWAKKSPAPSDWIYVYDFEKEDCPFAIPMPAGEGAKFKRIMDQAIKEIQREIPTAFQSEDYENTLNSYISQNNDKQAKRFSELEKIARQQGFQVKISRVGIETIPVLEGRAISEKEYSKLSQKTKSKIEDKRSHLEPLLLDFARKMRDLEIEAREYIKTLQEKVAMKILNATFGPAATEFSGHVEILKHLNKVQEDILENLSEFVDLFTKASDETKPDDGISDLLDQMEEQFVRYRVNLFVDNKNTNGAPVIIENNPTYYNLFGKVEKNVDHGIFLTDFTKIQAGSIHKANGGYLLVEANDLLKTPHVWDTFKRVLRNQLGFIEDMGEQFSMLPTTALRPEPIPLDLKVVLIGNDEIFHMLQEYDEEFGKVFKIKAEFDSKMKKTQENIVAYSSFIATRVEKEKLLNFDASAICAIVEYGSRMCEDQREITTRFSIIKDLCIEADFLAREEKKKTISRKHIEQATEERLKRVSLVEDSLTELLTQESILVSVSGTRIGQINGLAVYELGDFAFGKPVRITARTFVNDQGIFHVDRASKLTGSIHDKSVYILSGYLNALLAQERAVPFSASVCFEQSYGMIDGDSATMAELTVILSSLAEIPIKQNLAITGSLNQFGEVQPVGGINEKIEGFYRCALLLGNGDDLMVIIPHQNVANLMLNRETRLAVDEGKLAIYPVSTYEQAFKLATGWYLGTESITSSEGQKKSALYYIREKIKKVLTKSKKK